MPISNAAWRRSLRPASFRGIPFHVEVGSQAGGRRGPTHEFPNRDEPYSEDLGRKARRWPTAGYILDADYIPLRDALIAACEQKGPGTFVHPTLGEHQVKCDGYSVTESRERGGVCTFEFLFAEQGTLDPNTVTDDTQGRVNTAANASDAAAASSLNIGTGGKGGIGSDYVASLQASGGSSSASALGAE